MIKAIAIRIAIEGSLVAVRTITNANIILTRVLSIRFTSVGGNLGAAKAAYKPMNTFIAVLIYTLSKALLRTFSLALTTGSIIFCTSSIYNRIEIFYFIN